MANSNTYIRDGFVSAGSAQITGSLGVTRGITGSLQGTASYATQALSASYAPSAVGATFPYTGSAIITGSLNVIGNTTVTGSLNISSSLIASGNRVYVGPATFGNTPTGSGMDIVGPNQSNNYQGTLEIFSNTTGADNGGSILLGGMQTGPIMYPLAKIVSGFIGGSYGGYLSFWTELVSSTLTEKMRITTTGLVGIGTTTPTAVLQLKAGTATANTAPLKLTAGTNLTTPEAGAVEFDGTNLFFTTGSTRSTVLTNINPAGITGSLNITGSSTITNGALILSSSAISTYVLRTAGDSIAMIDNYGLASRSYLRIGTNGISIHNAGGDPTITCPIGMNLNSSATIYSSATSHIFYGGTNKQVSIGTAAVPTAKLHIAAGAAAATSAPIKLTSGTNLTTPEAGAVEFDGTNLFFTPSTVRQTILTNTNPASITGNVSVTGNLSSTAKYILGSDLSLTPIAGNQSVLTSWWGLQIVGNKQSTVDYTPSAIGNNSDFSVIIPNQQAAKIGLIVRGQTSQTGNLLELRNVSNTGLSAFDASGQLALGKTTPTAVLDVNGNARVTGSLLLSGSSLVAGFNPTPLAGTIKDGVTSVLGSLNDWDSNYYQGDVLYSETAAGTITFGQLCYRTQNETWELADASVFGAASTYMLGICVKSSTATNPTSILINGFVETATYAAILKTGEPLYMTTTPGSMSKSVPSASGNIVRIIGHTFWDSNTNTKIIIRFNPENSWIELT